MQRLLFLPDGAACRTGLTESWVGTLRTYWKQNRKLTGKLNR